MYTKVEDDQKWHKEYYKRNRKRLLADKRKYYQEHKLERAVYDKKYYIENRVKKSQYNRLYNIKNQKYRILHQRKYYKENRKEILGRQQSYPILKPWSKTWNYINTRVKSSKYYLDKGIKNSITIRDLEYLWFRDQAYKMKKPSVHRKNNNGNYTKRNCAYIELGKHIKMHKLKRGE